MLKSWPSVPQNVIVFGENAFKEIMKSLGRGFKPAWLVSLEELKIRIQPWTEGRPCDNLRKMSTYWPRRGSPKKPILPTPWSQASDLHSCEKAHFCRARHRVWRTCFWQPSRANTSVHWCRTAQNNDIWQMYTVFREKGNFPGGKQIKCKKHWWKLRKDVWACCVQKAGSQKTVVHSAGLDWGIWIYLGRFEFEVIVKLSEPIQ